jgi:hypothetical protein
MLGKVVYKPLGRAAVKHYSGNISRGLDVFETHEDEVRHSFAGSGRLRG